MVRKHLISGFLMLCMCLWVPTSGYGQGYDRAGWEADLSTLFHGVDGTVRIVDHNTLQVEDFYFDGGGPQVYFYLGREDTDTAFRNGVSVGPLLSGTNFVDESLTVELLPDVNLDNYNAISVWCAAVNVSFGSGTFAPVVNYKVRFSADWNSATQQPFPPDANFSGFIGVTHKTGTTFWHEGQTASFGIEDLAELGNKTTLTDEIENAISNSDAYGLFNFRNTIDPTSNASTGFKMQALHPEVTLVSKITPSPDWFVGVSGIPLYQNGEWRREVVVDLYPYDAGTDSGTDFDSADQNVFPPEPISRITGFPFDMGTPLGTVTFRLDCPEPPVGDLNRDCRVDFADLALMTSNWLLDCAATPEHPDCPPPSQGR